MKYPVLSLLIAPLLGTALHGQTQVNTVGLLREGQTLPSGDQVVSFRNLRVNDSGDWAVIVQTDNPEPKEDATLWFNGTGVIMEGDNVPFQAGLPIEELVDMDLDGQGERATIFGSSLGTYLFYRGNFVMQEGSSAAALGLGPTATYQQMFKVQVNANEDLLVRCLVDAPAVAPIPSSCLVRLEVGPGGVILSETLLGSSGDILPGQATPLLVFNNGDNAVSFRGDGSGTWSGLLGPLGSPSPHVLYEGNSNLLAQGGAATPIAGRSWATQQVRASASTPTSTAFSGLLDGSDLDDEVLIQDGAVIVREGDSIAILNSNPNVTGIGYENLHMTVSNELIYAVSIDTSPTNNKVILRGNEPLLRRGWSTYQGAEITNLLDEEHGFHASRSGQFLLSRVELDGVDEGLVLTQSPLGITFCGATTNSTGTFATTLCEGSGIASVDNFGLKLIDAPPGQFSYFLCSMTESFIPLAGGSQGTLCLGGTIGRFISQVGQISAAGTFAIDVDLGNIPTTPSLAVQSGDSWRFQAWYRDANPTSTSNFSLPRLVIFR